MSHPDVRRARPTDQDTVGDLWVQLLDEQDELEERFGIADDARDRWDNDYPLWLDDEIAGFATAHRWGPPPIYEESSEVYLDELYVRPEDRREGLGTQLVEAVRNWSDQVGAERIRLNLLSANEDARDFWAAQDATPLTLTFTIERTGGEEGDDEGSKKIGF